MLAKSNILTVALIVLKPEGLGRRKGQSEYNYLID